MRSRNTLLLLVFLVLAGFAAYYFLNKNSGKSTLNEEESNFMVSDTASVDKIFISTKSGKTNTLERQPDNSWLINNRYEARKDLVVSILETLKRMEVKRPADKASRNSAIRDFATMGRKVEIYQNGKLTKTFYVGNTTDDHLGTYFIMEGSENPYVMHIPGFQGFLSTRFDLDETKWRSVPVFRTSPENLMKLVINYPTNPKESFTIARENGKLDVLHMENENEEDVKAYVENFKFINGEFFIPDPQNRVSDSLALQKHVAEITIVDKDPEKSGTVLLYARPNNPDKLVALDTKTKEPISVQTFVFNRLLIRKEALAKK